ncbi:MAG: ABC transporter permease, partial [Gemmatimonadota bacterium]
MGVPRAYRLLLRLLPRELRDRFRSDMETAFADRLSTARSSSGRASIWVRGIVDILTEAVLARITQARSSRKGRGWSERGHAVDGLTQDIRWALRSLRRSPLLSTVAVLTLTLAIGASSATFSVVDAVLLRDMPYQDPDRLVVVWPQVTFNPSMVAEVTAEVPALESVTGVSGWNLTLTGAGEPVQVKANRVSPNHFTVLGVTPGLGRGLEPADGLPGAPGVVVLSHDFWMRAFGGDPSILGRQISLAGADADTRSVVGVMPPGFRPAAGSPSVWVPLTRHPSTLADQDDGWYVNQPIGRLAPGASAEQAQAQLRAYARRLRQRVPFITQATVQGATVRPLQQYVTRSVGAALWATLGAVSLVLLIACANVANLMLVRGESRRKDLAVRAALGAGRRRATRMFLVEGMMLSLLGGGLGIVLSYVLVDLVVALAPAGFPRMDEVGINGTVLAFSVVVTAAATLASVLVPAARLGRIDETASLGRASRGAGDRSVSTLSRTLIGAETAQAIVVAVGAALMLRSLERLTAEDVGLDGRDVLVARTVPPSSRYSDPTVSAQYNMDVQERVAALPGIAQVGGIDLLPGTGAVTRSPTWPEGSDESGDGEVPFVNFRIVAPGYFEAAGVPVLLGRTLSGRDGGTSEKVMVVNQAFADRFWPDRDPIGRSVRTQRPGADLYRVVGVVGDVRQAGLAAAPEPEMYVTQSQWGVSRRLWVIARVEVGSPLDHAEAVRDAIWSVDAEVPIPDVDDLASVFDRSAATTRFLTVVLTSFGVISLVLGGIGVFGITAFAVGRRLPEFGVRIALGSSRVAVLREALSTSLIPVVGGLVVGLGSALVSGAALRTVLYEIE